eukprot:3866664-Pyramimonas_sp.AAC.1
MKRRLGEMRGSAWIRSQRTFSFSWPCKNEAATPLTIAKYQLLLPTCIVQCAGFREEFENAAAKSPN